MQYAWVATICSFSEDSYLEVKAEICSLSTDATFNSIKITHSIFINGRKLEETLHHLVTRTPSSRFTTSLSCLEGVAQENTTASMIWTNMTWRPKIGPNWNQRVIFRHQGKLMYHKWWTTIKCLSMVGAIKMKQTSMIPLSWRDYHRR